MATKVAIESESILAVTALREALFKVADLLQRSPIGEIRIGTKDGFASVVLMSWGTYKALRATIASLEGQLAVAQKRSTEATTPLPPMTTADVLQAFREKRAPKTPPEY